MYEEYYDLSLITYGTVKVLLLLQGADFSLEFATFPCFFLC